VEEGTDGAALAQAVRWLAAGDEASGSTEARIARLLEDLHAHLELVEGLHDSMRRVMDASSDELRPQLDPAPKEVLDAISPVTLDAGVFEELRQTSQCVICCSDFELNETLNRLPGCGHLFHDECIHQWLDRATNCPICRCNLRKAVGLSEVTHEAEAVRREGEPDLQALPQAAQQRRSTAGSRPGAESGGDGARGGGRGAFPAVGGEALDSDEAAAARQFAAAQSGILPLPSVRQRAQISRQAQRRTGGASAAHGPRDIENASSVAATAFEDSVGAARSGGVSLAPRDVAATLGAVAASLGEDLAPRPSSSSSSSRRHGASSAVLVDAPSLGVRSSALRDLDAIDSVVTLDAAMLRSSVGSGFASSRRSPPPAVEIVGGQSPGASFTGGPPSSASSRMAVARRSSGGSPQNISAHTAAGAPSTELFGVPHCGPETDPASPTPVSSPSSRRVSSSLIGAGSSVFTSTGSAPLAPSGGLDRTSSRSASGGGSRGSTTAQRQSTPLLGQQRRPLRSSTQGLNV